MRKSDRILSFQVACVYIGTVVGAGFASGREIHQFFGQYGNWAYLGILITSAIFAWLGYKMLDLGRKLNATSFREMNRYLFGRFPGHIVDTLILLMLFGVTVAMLAGSGELFLQSLHINFQIGVLVTIAITFLTLLFGISGLLRANSIIVPLMMGFVVFTAVATLVTHGLHPAIQHGTAETHHPLSALVSALIYAAMNVGLSAGVLVPLGNQIGKQEVLKQGAIYGAMGLGGMLLLACFTLLTYGHAIMNYSIPMAFVATKFGSVIQWGFTLVLWGEIYSTLVGNVYAMSSQVAHRSQTVVALYTGCLLVVAFLCSQIGFSNIVAYGYTIFGWVSLLILLALVWPRKNLPTS